MLKLIPALLAIPLFAYLFTIPQMLGIGGTPPVMELQAESGGITVELPADEPVKYVGANSITSLDTSWTYKGYSLHYYILRIPKANVKSAVNMDNVAYHLDMGSVSNVTVYPVISEMNYSKVIGEDENGTNITRLYTNYTTSAAGEVDTSKARVYVVVLRVANPYENGRTGLVGGSYNLTISGIEFDPEITRCSTTISDSGYYWLTDDETAASGKNCIEIEVDNVELNCTGYSITGVDGTDIQYGISINAQSNITIKNCHVNSFYINFRIYSSSYANILNCSSNDRNAKSDSILLLYYGSASNNNITNSSFGPDTFCGYYCASPYSIYQGNTFSSSDNFQGTNQTIINNTFSTSNMTLYDSNITGNQFINSITFNMNTYTGTSAFKNNTFKNNLIITECGGTCLFYLNNFTKPVTDNDATTNYYNYSGNGTNMGNMWKDVLNGSVSITGTTTTPWSDLYYGSAGSGYPYNNTNDVGFITGNIVDYAPLTKTFGSSDNSPSIQTAIAFANGSSHHWLNATATVTHPDGATNISAWAAITANGTCTNVSNNDSGNLKTVTINCTGYGRQQTSINITFYDSDYDSASTNGTTSYPNQKPTITNLAPNGGGTYSSDSIVVNFTTADADNDNRTIFVSYSADSGATWIFVANTSMNATSLTWDTSALTPKTTYRVNASVYDRYENGTSAVSASDFTIDRAIAIETTIAFANGSSHHWLNATATASDGDGAADIVAWQAITANGSCVNVTSNTTGDLKTVTVNCTGYGLQKTSINISFYDSLYQMASTNSSTSFPNQKPTVTGLAPNGGEEYTTTSIVVNFTSADTDNDNRTVFLSYSNDSGTTWYYIATSTVNASSYTWDTSAMPSLSTYRLNATPADDSPENGTSDVSDSDFTLTIAVDTCTYTSGDWEVDCSDNCVIDSNVDLGGNDLKISGTGKFIISAARISNCGEVYIVGTDETNICEAYVIGGEFCT